MKMHSVQRQTSELGTAWFLVPVLWAVVALVGCALIANWPGLFDEPTAQAPASATHASASVTPEEQP